MEDFTRKTIVLLPSRQSRFELKSILSFLKVSVLFFDLLVMSLYDNYSISAVLMTVLRSSYGIVWVLKESIMPSAELCRQISFKKAAIHIIVQVALFFIDFGCISNKKRYSISSVRIATVMFTYICGLFFYLGASAQKHFTLSIKKSIVTEGFYRVCRNPVSLGKCLIYLSFCFLANSFYSYMLVLGLFGVWVLPEMIDEEKASMIKPGYREYADKVGFLLPIIGDNALSSIIFYVLAVLFCTFLYVLCDFDNLNSFKV